MNKITSLLRIGSGALVLPFLDNKEADQCHVSEEISLIIQQFPFHSIDNLSLQGLWRHRGVTYHKKADSNKVYKYNGWFVGFYSHMLDEILYQSQLPKMFSRDRFERTIKVKDVTYLVQRDSTMWVYTSYGIVGPYFLLAEDMRVVYCPDIEHHRLRIDEALQEKENRERSMTPIQRYHSRRLDYEECSLYIPLQPIEEQVVEQSKHVLAEFTAMVLEIIDKWPNDAEEQRNFLYRYLPPIASRDTFHMYQTYMDMFIDLQEELDMHEIMKIRLRDHIYNRIENSPLTINMISGYYGA